jgi:ketosteroid isomerase-like protein
MSDANRAIVENTYTAFNRGDIQAVLESVKPNARWLNHGPATVPYFGDFTGRIAEFFQALGDSTSGGKVMIERYITTGDAVVTEGRFTAMVRSTGAAIDAPIAHVFTIRGGQIAGWTGYGDTAAVLAAHTAQTASA